MTEKRKSIREKIGQVFQVPLGDGTFGYGQVATKGPFVFFDYLDRGEAENLNTIIDSPRLFRITVDQYAITRGLWPILGVLPVKPEYQEARDVFSYDSEKGHYVIWSWKSGDMEQIPATADQIQNLEYFASWSPRAAKERLIDHFAGRPNYEIESGRHRHDPNFPDMVEFYRQYGYEYPLDEILAEEAAAADAWKDEQRKKREERKTKKGLLAY
jgi:hypothetical protein